MKEGELKNWKFTIQKSDRPITKKGEKYIEPE